MSVFLAHTAIRIFYLFPSGPITALDTGRVSFVIQAFNLQQSWFVGRDWWKILFLFVFCCCFLGGRSISVMGLRGMGGIRWIGLGEFKGWTGNIWERISFLSNNSQARFFFAAVVVFSSGQLFLFDFVLDLAAPGSGRRSRVTATATRFPRYKATYSSSTRTTCWRPTAGEPWPPPTTSPPSPRWSGRRAPVPGASTPPYSSRPAPPSQDSTITSTSKCHHQVLHAQKSYCQTLFSHCHFKLSAIFHLYLWPPQAERASFMARNLTLLNLGSHNLVAEPNATLPIGGTEVPTKLRGIELGESRPKWVKQRMRWPIQTLVNLT